MTDMTSREAAAWLDGCAYGAIFGLCAAFAVWLWLG